MSEYNDTANPLLNGHPQDINCGANNPPQWDYTEDVGYSALCPASDNTWTIMSAIIHQLDATTPGAYQDLGGDEVPSTLLSQSQYADFINKEAGIIQAEGKTVMGWADIAGPGTDFKNPSVAEYWNPDSGSQPGTITGTEAVSKGMEVVMAPANHAYLDQKYVAGKAGNVPPTLGLSWACNSGCDVDQFYNWDPGSYVTGVTDRNVIGVEGAVWGETVVNLSTVTTVKCAVTVAVPDALTLIRERSIGATRSAASATSHHVVSGTTRAFGRAENKVSWRPAGPSRRLLRECHGVGVGSATTSAPAAASLSVAEAASPTWKATRTCPATRRPTSTSSMYSAWDGSAISSVARPASRMVTRPPGEEYAARSGNPSTSR